MISTGNRYLLSLGLCVTSVLGGCATPQGALDAKGTGARQIYDKPKPVVWAAMKKAISETGGVVSIESENDCEIAAKYGVTAFSWGERVGLFCRPISEGKTETEVVSKRALSTNITAKNWTREIFEVLDSELR